jgi:hypothetical protein
MKKHKQLIQQGPIKAFLILIFCGSSSCYSSSIKIQKDDVSVAGVMLGIDYNWLLSKLGQPEKVEHIEPEMDIEPYDKYYYGKSFFVITNKIVTGFEINDSNLELSHKIKVGDDLEKVKKVYSERLVFERDQAKVRLNNSDDYLLFVFVNNKVYSFSIYSEN